MSLITVMCGISGSGKSTRAKQLFTQYGGFEKCIIVSRDKIREQLFNFGESEHAQYYRRPDFARCEKEVSIYEDNLIKFSLSKGKAVISDNTHLRVKYLNHYQKFHVPIVYELVECGTELAITRDSNRIRQVGTEIIKKQYHSLQKLKETFDFKPWYPDTFRKPEHDLNKENCVVFDIDGTLALHGNLRSPYDWSKVSQDELSKDIAALYMYCNAHKFECNTPKLIICSGRDGICKQDTIDWLHYYGLTFDEIFIRAQNDSRPDWIVKTEFIKEISAKYNVIFCVDDRQQVVDCYRALGFTVLQVDYGDF
jgi:predicted kinase